MNTFLNRTNKVYKPLELLRTLNQNITNYLPLRLQGLLKIHQKTRSQVKDTEYARLFVYAHPQVRFAHVLKNIIPRSRNLRIGKTRLEHFSCANKIVYNVFSLGIDFE